MLIRLLAAFACTVALAHAGELKAAERVSEAKQVFDEIMVAPDRSIPRDLLDRAYCVVIVPDMKKGGFIFGGHYGVGVTFCRGKGHTGWVGPSTVRLEGGSFGFQIGGGEVDLVLLVMNQAGARKLLMKSKFTLGADASVMAGPVGRYTAAETDAFMRAEILAWSRSRGIFAGAVVKGGTLRVDNKANQELYGREVKQAEVLEGKYPTPPAARDLARDLRRHSPRERG